jgi:DNA-binding NarL/FixJ family response regulator
MSAARLTCVDSRAPRPTGPKRLVLVADSSLMVEAIRVAFRASGEFKLVGYANGRRTAARTILDAQPDVILLDDMEQSEQAIALLQQIRSEDRDVAVLALSAQLDAAWLDRVFGAGATAVISKSTRPSILATLVRETLNGHIVHRPPPAAQSSGAPMAGAGAQDLPLTPRELEILQLVASGAPNGDIARRLWVTEQTVKFHLRNIYRKLDVANRTQASHFAHARGLVDFGPASARHLSVAAS